MITTTKEEWAILDGFKKYEISTLGRVRNISSGIILKASRNNTTGYYQYKLSGDDGVFRGMYTHRLVALCFLPNPEEKKTVNHIDGDKSNNTLENLEWASHKEQTKHAMQNGLRYCADKKYIYHETLVGYSNERFEVIEYLGTLSGTMPYYVIRFHDTKNEKIVDKYKILNNANIKDSVYLVNINRPDYVSSAIYTSQKEICNALEMSSGNVSKIIKTKAVREDGLSITKAVGYTIPEEAKRF